MGGGVAAQEWAEGVVVLVLFQPVVEFAVLAHQLGLFERAIDHEAEVVEIDRLG